MLKIFLGYLWLTVILVAIGLVGGREIFYSATIGFVGLLVALRYGMFRTISSEKFVLKDCYGRKRAELGGAVPPEGHVIGADWDPSPGLDLYYRDGTKGAAVMLDFHNGEEISTMALFHDNGQSTVSINNSGNGQAIQLTNSPSGKSFIIQLESNGDFKIADDKGINLLDPFEKK